MTGTESQGGEDAGRSERGTTGLHLRGHTACLLMLAGTGGTGRQTPPPRAWHGRSQLSLAGQLACKRSSGDTQANDPHGHIHPLGAKPEEKPPWSSGRRPTHTPPPAGLGAPVSGGSRRGIGLPPPVHTPPQLLPLPGKGDSHRQMSRSKSEKGAAALPASAQGRRPPSRAGDRDTGGQSSSHGTEATLTRGRTAGKVGAGLGEGLRSPSPGGRGGQRQVGGHPRTSSSFPPLRRESASANQRQGAGQGREAAQGLVERPVGPGPQGAVVPGWQQSLSWGALRSGGNPSLQSP